MMPCKAMGHMDEWLPDRRVGSDSSIGIDVDHAHSCLQMRQTEFHGEGRATRSTHEVKGSWHVDDLNGAGLPRGSWAPI